MKNFILLLFLVALAMNAQAQNKTFSIGAISPNLNAALDVVSPTNNQGVLMPRLTTAQRTAMSLTATDIGLQLYDTDLKGIYAWDGAGWRNGGLVLPLVASVSSPSNAVDIANTGTGSAGNFIVNNTASVRPALNVTSNSNNNGDAIRGVQTGTGGTAANFALNNAANWATAVIGTTEGTGVAGYFEAKNAAAGSTALMGITRSNVGGAVAPVGVYGESSGTGSSGGAFRITNAANAYSALYASTIGTGAATFSETSTGYTAIHGKRAGTTNGFAGFFEITNAANNYEALKAQSNGKAAAGRFEILNNTSTSPALLAINFGNGAGLEATTSGVDAGVRGRTTGTGTGVHAETATGWTSLYAKHTGATTGHAGYFEISNATNTNAALSATTVGNGGIGLYSKNSGNSGNAAFFTATNSTNPNATLQVEMNGVGEAISGLTSTGWTAIHGRKDGPTPGNAGFFESTNAANPNAALYAKSLSIGAAGYFETPNANFNTVAAALVGITNGLNNNAAVFKVVNAGSTAASVWASSVGTGPAGYFENISIANSSPSVWGITYGGIGVSGRNTGASGTAGYFEATSSGHQTPALHVRNSGISTALLVEHVGSSGDFVIFSTGEPGPTAPKARIDKAGKGFFNGGTQNSGADVAEMFDVEGDKENYEPGDVLVISESTDRTVEQSSEANSTKVVGVYATKPGVTLTEKGIEENLDLLVPMGVIGVIPTKVCLENGPIKRGDLLVTSSRKGHAMKAVSPKGDGMFPAGIILGKALENFDGTESGMIKVFVNVK